MSKFRRLKQSTRILPGTALCNDCGLNTMPPGKPKRGTFEQFICRDEVWAAAGMTPGKVGNNNELVGGGFLCVGCIEIRLGRRLTIDDIKPICQRLAIGGPWHTERLRSRMLYRTQQEEDAAKVAPAPKTVPVFGEDGFGWCHEIVMQGADTVQP
jgi:hypothetical protein